ncbi:MAG: xanthomonadin biosynthesis protein [Rhodanobacteraceae bacterium]
MSSSTANQPIAPRASMRWLPPLLVAYALLALLGGVLHRPVLSLVAAALLLFALAVPVLRRPSVVGVCLWLALAALLLIPAALGRVQLALAGLPIAILGALAWLFARSLGREPLIARCIRVIESEQRLGLPGVAPYARGVTVYWAIVLGLQALVLVAIWLLAKPGGALDAVGVAVPFAMPRATLAWYPEIGCWAVLISAFAAEYVFRRWTLRRIPHPPLKEFLARLVRRWPELLREEVNR